MSSKLLLIAAGALALAGCSTANKTYRRRRIPAFGEAVKYNAAIQTINPDPVYAADGAKPGDSGAKGAAAVKRYRTDKVKRHIAGDAAPPSGSSSARRRRRRPQ